MNLVWLKRDLRLRDHQPLRRALDAGRPLLIAYWFEPSILTDPHADERHFRFIHESLADLNEQLAEHGARVHVFHGEVLPALQRLHAAEPIEAIFSHEEVGLQVTFDRDKTVARFCREAGIRWLESPSNGVVRGLKNRADWAFRWERFMNGRLQTPDWRRYREAEIPAELLGTLRGEALPEEWRVPLAGFQPGGEIEAHDVLRSFLGERLDRYSASISKPHQSRTGCSRLSPYLAWGNLSMRQVVQAARRRGAEGTGGPPLRAFTSRLHWQGHFIQKFESECRIEFEPVNRGFAAMTFSENEIHFRAWAEGRTGYPLVDACMRCLAETGYLNFRMRAMLVSFATHLLNLHWKGPAVYLARLFLDFEPGIHYAQHQMQAGMTGTNTLRIYNPVKQSHDHDPAGTFLREWVPELRSLPEAFLHEPWTMTPIEQDLYDFHLGIDYPAPVVDWTAAARAAKLRHFAQRQTAAVQAENARILATHVVPGSRRMERRKPAAKPKKTKQLPALPVQPELSFG